MSKLFSLFLDRLAERLAALVAGSISSRVEGLHATVQADQQSQLEDLARRYEADGKIEIAAALRQRSARLVSTDLAAEAVEVVSRLTDDPPRLTNSVGPANQGDLRGLPDFSGTPPAAGKRRRKAIEGNVTPNTTGEAT